jgi:hypothetical protein
MFLKLPKDKIKLLFIPNPLTPFDAVEKIVDFESHKTVANYCTSDMPVIAGIEVCYNLNGVPVPPNTLVPHGSFIAYNLTIMGGGDPNNTLNLVAKIAIAAAAIYFLGPGSQLVSGPSMFGFGLEMGLSGWTAFATGTALTVGATWAGSMIIDSVFPLTPITEDVATSDPTMGPITRNYGYGPATNYAVEGTPIPELLGTTKFAPILISGHRSLGMSEVTDDIEAQDQYLNLLYLVGTDNIQLGAYEKEGKLWNYLWIDGILAENYGNALQSIDTYYNDPDSDEVLTIPPQFSNSVLDKDVNDEITYLSETSSLYVPDGSKNANVLSSKYEFDDSDSTYLFTTGSGIRAIKVEVSLPMGGQLITYHPKITRHSGSGDRDRIVTIGCKTTEQTYTFEGQTWTSPPYENITAMRFKIVVHYRKVGDSAWEHYDSYYSSINATRALNYELGVVFPEEGEWEFKVNYEIDSTSYGYLDKNPFSSLVDSSFWGSALKCGPFLSWAGEAEKQPQFLQWAEYGVDYSSSQTQSQNVDALVVVLTFPNGLYKINDNGAYIDHTVTYEITMYENGVPVDTSTTSVTKASTNSFRKKQTFTNLNKGSIYSFKVRYAEPPVDVSVPAEDRSKYQTTLYFDYVQEVIDSPFAYPGCSLLALKFKAVASSMSAPLVELEGSRIFDTLNASMGKLPLNSPAWAALYFIRKSGVLESDILLEEFDELAYHCSLLNENAHAFEPDYYRYLISWYVDEQYTLRSILDEIGRTCRALIIQKGTKWGVNISRPTIPKTMFSDGNIRKGSYSKTYIRDAEKANAVVVWYWDADNNYERTGLLVRDSVNLAEGAVLNKAEFVLKTVKSKEHAKAFATHVLNQTNAVQDAITWETAIDGIGCSVGDVVYFGKSRTENLTAGGRLIDVTKHTAIIDDIAVLDDTKDYRLEVRFDSHSVNTSYTCNFSNNENLVAVADEGELALEVANTINDNMPPNGSVTLNEGTDDEIAYFYTSWSGAVFTLVTALTETYAPDTPVIVNFERIIPVNEVIDVDTPSTGGIVIDGDEYGYTSWSGKFFTISVGLQEAYVDDSIITILFDQDLLRTYTIPAIEEKTDGNDLYWKTDFWGGWENFGSSVFAANILTSSTSEYDLVFDSLVDAINRGILDGGDYPQIAISVTRTAGSGWDGKFSFERKQGISNTVTLPLGSSPSVGTPTEFLIDITSITAQATSGRMLNDEWNALISALKFNLGISNADVFTINYIKFIHDGVNTTTVQLINGWIEGGYSEIIPTDTLPLYSLGLPDKALAAKPVRIANIERADGLYFKITGCTYDENSYADAFVVSTIEEFPANINYIDNLVASEKWQLSSGVGVAFIELTWRGLGSSWNIFISQQEDEGFVLAGTVDAPKFTVPSDLLSTLDVTYYFKVEQVGLGGKNDAGTSIVFLGKPEIPTNVANVSVSRVVAGVELQWDVIETIWVQLYDVSIYEGETEIFSTVNVSGDAFTYKKYLNPGTYTCKVRGVDIWNQTSAEWTEIELVVGELSAPATLTANLTTIGTNLFWDSVEDVWPLSFKISIEDVELGINIKDTKFSHNELLESGTYEYKIEVQNANNIVSSNSISTDASITVPNIPVNLEVKRTADNLIIEWEKPVKTSYPVLTYDLVFYRDDVMIVLDTLSGANPSTDDYSGTTFLAKLNLTTRTVEGFSIYKVGVVAKDGANESIPAHSEQYIYKPEVITAFNIKTINNNILLDWEAAEHAQTLLPVSHYKIKRSEETGSFDTAVDTGDKDGTFTNFFEYLSGMFTYYIQPVDVEGNLGNVVSKTVEVKQDPNFVLNKEWYNVVKNDNPAGWGENIEYPLNECVSQSIWEDLTPGATARRLSSSCEYNGKMYVYGGQNSGETYLSDFYSYDIATDAWEALDSGAFATGLGLLIPDGNGKIYHYGGYDGTTRNYFQVYDIATDTWSTLTGQHATSSAGGGIYDGKLYIIGGYTTTTLNVIWEYAIATSTWTQKTDCAPLYGFGFVTYKDKYVYCVCGQDASIPLNAVYAYNMSTDVWTLQSSASPFDGRRYPSAELINNKIIMFGGHTNATDHFDDLWIFDMLTHDWEQILSDGAGAYFISSCVKDKIMYLFSGDVSENAYTNNMRKLDIGTFICVSPHTSGTGYDEPATLYGYAYWERYRIEYSNAVITEDVELIMGVNLDMSFDEWWGAAATFDDVPHNSIYMPSVESYSKEEFDYFEFNSDEADGERIENDGSEEDSFLDSSTVSIAVTKAAIGGVVSLTTHLQGVRETAEFFDVDGDNITAFMYFTFRYIQSKIKFTPESDDRLALLKNNTLTLASHKVEESGNGILAAVPQDDLVGWWKLDDDSTTVEDFSGNNNDGTLVNATGSAFTDGGLVNYKDLTLDSSNDQYATIPTNLVDISAGMTVSMWLLINEFPSDADPRYFTMLDSGGDNFQLAILGQDGANPYVNVRVNGTSEYALTPLEHGKFYHIVAVLDNAYNLIIYINGVAQTLASGGISSNGIFPAIGGRGSSSSYTGDGKLDDVRLYSIPLTSDQDFALYEQGVGKYIEFAKDFVEVISVGPEAIGTVPVVLNAQEWDEANPEGCRIRAWDIEGKPLLTEQKFSYRVVGYQ